MKFFSYKSIINERDNVYQLLNTDNGQEQVPQSSRIPGSPEITPTNGITHLYP